MFEVHWKGGLAFEARPPSGATFIVDAHPESGGEGKGPTPIEALLTAVAACSAIDVVLILAKKRQQVTAYRIEVDGARPPIGQWPRPFESIRIKHILEGPDLDPDAVARAVELSDTKYCSVIATLRAAPAVVSEWTIENK
ncbi:MAG TPA: OsmC family protein [Fimbriimonadaceae bacterium]|nr:OsmC family protein [Fimbriimonadaceae bacterium]